jgi:hypothetical protein
MGRIHVKLSAWRVHRLGEEEEDGLQIGRVAEKTLNKQSGAGSKWWTSSSEIAPGVSSL